MIKGGYILQPRCFDSSDAAHLPPVTREVWFYVLRNVSHKDGQKFKRGQGLFSIPDIMKALSWFVGYRPMTYSKTQVAKALRRLRDDHMMTTAKTTRGLIITVLNYSHFQDPKNYEDHSEESTKVLRRSRGDDTIDKNVKKKEVKKEPKPPAVEIPESLNTDSFKTAWTEWEQHRRELGVKKYKPLGQQRLFTKLSKWGSDRAVAAIYFSMGQNYQGIFEESAGGKPKQQKTSVASVGRRMMLEAAEREKANADNDGAPVLRLGDGSR